MSKEAAHMPRIQEGSYPVLLGFLRTKQVAAVRLTARQLDEALRDPRLLIGLCPKGTVLYVWPATRALLGHAA